MKRQTNKQQSGQQQAAPPQSAKLAGSEPIVEQQGVVPDEEPLLEADFPLPGSLKLPTFFFFFFFFFFRRERYSLHECNDSNLKSM